MDPVAVMDATTIAVPLAVVVCRFTAAIDRISRAPILWILPVLYGLMSELIWFPYLLSCMIPYRPDQYDVVPLALEARNQGKIPAVAQWILAFRQRTFAPDRDDSPAGLKTIFDSLINDYRQTVAARQNNLTILAISQAMITRQRLDWKADFEWWTLRMFFPTTQDDCSPSFYFSNCCDRCIVSSRSPPHQADHLPHHGRMSTPNSPRR